MKKLVAVASFVLASLFASLAFAQDLHPDYGEPLLMRCVRGMTYAQIADALGVPLTTVETRLARARRMLRERMDQDDSRRHAAAGAS